MNFRFLGLVPAIALLAVGTAHAQPVQPNNSSTGGGGSMAYPDSLPSGKVNIPAPTARDTGNMAYPASPGGVSQTAPTARDTGNMAYPAGTGTVTSTPATRARRAPMRSGATPAAMATPAAPPTAADMAAARGLETAPSSTPVPYTDFAAPAATMRGHHAPMMMHKKPMHPVAAKKAATPAAATPAPATPAPAK